MVATGKIRASGQTTAEEITPEETKDFDKPAALEVDKPINLTRAFRRMRTDWNSEDRSTIQAVKSTVDQAIFEDFKSAYGLMYEIYDTVRLPIINQATGELKVDESGLAIWQQREDGSYVEDWDRIKRKDRERFINIIITRMFEWEQTAADIWGEAIFAKAQLDEAFSTAFDSISDPKVTVDARTARGKRLSADSRYLAVYKSYYSRKADAIVRTMLGISQRLKDLHVS
jgi:hypothetical protein